MRLVPRLVGLALLKAKLAPVSERGSLGMVLTDPPFSTGCIAIWPHSLESLGTHCSLFRTPAKLMLQQRRGFRGATDLSLIELCPRHEALAPARLRKLRCCAV